MIVKLSLGILLMFSSCENIDKNKTDQSNININNITTPMAKSTLDSSRIENGFYRYLEGHINNRKATMILIKNEEFKYLTGYYYYNDEQIPHYLIGYKEVSINGAEFRIHNFRQEKDMYSRYGINYNQHEKYVLNEREKVIISNNGQSRDFVGRFLDKKFTGKLISKHPNIPNEEFEFTLVEKEALKIQHKTYSTFEKISQNSTMIITFDMLEMQSQEVANDIKKSIYEIICNNYDKNADDPISATKPCRNDITKECLEDDEDPCFQQYCSSVAFCNDRFISFVVSSNNTTKAFSYDLIKRKRLKITDLFASNHEQLIESLIPKSIEKKFSINYQDQHGYDKNRDIDYNSFYITGKGVVFIQDYPEELSGIQLFIEFEDLKKILNPNFLH